MKTSYLEESRRQKTAALKTAVVCLAAGEQIEGLDQLETAGMIHELRASEARHQSITLDYLSLPQETRAQTLILSGTNIERLELTQSLRKALQDERSLGRDVFTLHSLRPRDQTAEQRKYACTYELNDIVVPVRDYRRYGMKRRGQYRVISKDLARNRLTLQSPDGHQFPFDPATCADKTTYQVQQLPIGAGEQLRWTRNEAVKGVRNGQLVTVETIGPQGTATLRDGKGDAISLPLTGHQYLDYSLVSTTYSSQGKTAECVLSDIDSTLSKEGLYVAVSRAKTTLKLYTADKEQLYKKVQRSAAQMNPSDFLTLFNLVNPNAKNEKAADSARLLRGTDQSEYIGDLAGERGAECYRAAARRDAGAEGRSRRVERPAASISLGVRANAAESHRAAETAGRAIEAVVSRGRGRVAKRAKHRRHREIYQRYAAQFCDRTPQECDLLVARQLMTHLLKARSGQELTQDELIRVGRVLLEGLASQELQQSEGKPVSIAYVTGALGKEQERVEKAQQAKEKSSDQGMSL